MAKTSQVWLTYGLKTQTTASGWNVWVTSATIAAPHAWQGREIFRFALSRNAHIGPYHDKNRLGRKLETRYFLTRAEALDAAKSEAAKRG